MVVYLQGKIGDDLLIFEKNEKGLWSTTVPFIESGRYVIRLCAVDEAGNESYYATAIFTVDIESLVMKIEFVSYGAEIKGEYEATIESKGYNAEVVKFDTKESR
jgi:hypothetical protein